MPKYELKKTIRIGTCGY